MLRPYFSSHRGSEGTHHGGQVVIGNRFVERYADARLRQRPQVDLLHARDVHDARQHIRRYFDGQRIEEMGIGEAVSQLFERRGERSRVRVDAPGDAAQPLRAVIHRVHRGNHGEEYLSGADVARRLLAPDVLLAGLQRHAQRRSPGAVLRDTDDAAREVALELVARREESGMRTAVAQRYAETLRVADGDICTPLAGWREQGEREQIGGHRDEGSRGVRGPAQRAVIADCAVGRGILEQRADHVALLEIESSGVRDDDVDAARGGSRAYDRGRLFITNRATNVR